MLTVADRGEGGDKICQNLADVICERSLIIPSERQNIDAIQILQMFADKVSVSANVKIIHLNSNQEI